jgi:hypothetical protein
MALFCAYALYFVQGQARDRDALPQLQPSHQHPRRGQGAHSALTCQHNNVTPLMYKWNTVDKSSETVL